MGKLNRDWVAGTLLIVAGLLLIGQHNFPDLVPFIPLVAGLVILAFFLLTRSVGALIAGSLIVGIGIGVLVVRGSDANAGAAGFLASLAGGFFLAWILGLLFNIHDVRWWPLLVGFVLLVVSGLVYSAGLGADVTTIAADWWPALLLAMGAYLLFHAHRRNEAEARESGESGGTRTEDEAHALDTDASSIEADEVDPNIDIDARQASAGYPVRASTHSLADATGGQVGGDRPGGVESL
jgi:hypothetical protein